jgi:N-acetylmuramoyl-L-alanine amidase
MMAKRFGFRLAVLASVWVVLAAAPCSASLRHPALARKAWLRAVEMQRNLKAKPAGKRTRAEYAQVIRWYRNVYYHDFAYVKAPVAVEAMADLYVEMGRHFHNPVYFKSAIKYYRYVVSQYPVTSMARKSAVAVGNVYLEDLNDPEQATDAYRAFLKKHPSSAQSREARKKLKEIARMQAAQKEQESAKARRAATANRASPRVAGGPAEVTEIHKWVGPNFTRVVIGARGPFQYNTLRLSHPARIVFDLPNTRVRRELIEKSVPVNGAYLRDIRVGQFKPDVTRIVLDVKDISDYSAFALPNPFRLIIDVHGTSTETARYAPEQVESTSSAAAKSTRTRQAVAEANSKEEVETSKRAEQAAKQEAAGPIEYQDQQAVKERAEAAKQKAKAGPGHPGGTAAKPIAGATSTNHVQANAKAKKKTASGRNGSEAAKKKIVVAAQSAPKAIPVSAKPASPTGNGSQTLTRALGLKVARIVIDPGHGGFDTGTIGHSGLREKDLVLDIGLRLRKLIETRTNSEVFMTRSTDKFIPLEERTAIANEDGADLFISIHANASPDRRVRGIETYFLNFTSDREALRLAARENATSQESVHQLQNLIKKIALNNKIEESQELARDIQSVLYKRMSRVSRGIHNRGVRKAPFVVLIGANMPSILTEISFLSNSHSERLLKSSSYREQIAKALFNGIENYISDLGSVRVAQRTQ